MLSSDYQEHLLVFEPQETCVKKFNHWCVFVRTQQLTLGDCIIAPYRKIPTFGALTAEEAVDLSQAIAWYERICTDMFSAVKFNYIAAMMRDDFAHLHAFPRYSSTCERYGLAWDDTRWPRVIQFGPGETPKDVIDMIVDDMRAHA